MGTQHRFQLFVIAMVAWVLADAAGAAPPADAAKGLASYLDSRAVSLTAAAVPPAKLADWQQRRNALRTKYLAILGLDPLPPRTPLNPRFVGEPLDLGQVVFRRVVFESLPKNYVAAHLYLPKQLRGPAPAIVYVPGHAGRDGYHQHPLSYAAHGYVAINLPALGEEGKVGGGMGCGHKGPYYDNYSWYNTGYNPAGAEVWDTIRAVDYLLSLRDESTQKPLVAPDRIGMAGRSGGAARTLWAMAAEPRIRAGVAAEGFTTVAGYRRALPGSCDVHLFANYYGLEYAELYGLAAPRPLLVQHGLTDTLYPHPQGVAGYLNPLYARHGASECFQLQELPQGHADTPALRQAEYAWFDRWLGKGVPGVTPITDEPVPEVLRNRENVRCFAARPTDAASVEQLFTPATPRWEVKSQADWAGFQARLSERLQAEPLRTAMLPFASELRQDGERFSLVVDRGLRHPAWFFAHRGAQHKTVILLAGAAEDPARLSAEFLAAGVNLLVIRPSGVDDAGMAKGQRQHVLRLAALVGETLTSLRVRDALGAVRAAAAHPSVDPNGIYLWGKGELAIPALYAAVVDARVAGVLLEDAPDHHTSETALFRILRHADIPQSAALLFPRPVFFLGTRAQGFQWTEDVYRVLGQPGRCTRSTAPWRTRLACE